jgi:DNA-binding response OmpR family regulator
MGVRLLVVEDKQVMADSIARSLRREGMAVDVAYDGAQALELNEINSYEVVLLDRDLPQVHGDEVCRRLAGRPARILMLTAADSIDDRVDGLTLGADDYLVKPFALTELVARIRALGRRPALAHPPILAVGGVALDPNRHRAWREGKTLDLTNKEFGVLEALLQADGGVLSAEQLLETVWDAHADPFTNTVRVTMANLRRKLGDPPMIQTIVGSGYRLVEP